MLICENGTKSFIVSLQAPPAPQSRARWPLPSSAPTWCRSGCPRRPTLLPRLLGAKSSGFRTFLLLLLRWSLACCETRLSAAVREQLTVLLELELVLLGLRLLYLSLLLRDLLHARWRRRRRLLCSRCSRDASARR